MISFLDQELGIINNKYFDGLTFDVNSMIVNRIFEINKTNVLVVTNNMYETNKLYEQIKTYTKDVYVFPVDDFISSIALSSSPELKVKRLETIRAIFNGKNKIIITNLMGYIHYLPSKEVSNENIKVKLNQTINRNDLLELLEKYGYTRSSIVTTTGEYAVRGFIVDVFGVEFDQPVRIEFFGDNIESIRYFDEITQLSTENIDYIVINPFKELVSEINSSLYDYLNNPILIKFDPNQILLSYKKLLDDVKYYKETKKIEDIDYFHPYNEKEKCIVIDTINKRVTNKTLCQEMINFDANINLLEEYFNNNISKGKKVLLYLPIKSQINYIISKINNYKIIENLLDLEQDKINIINYKINKGFVLNNYVVVSDSDYEKKHIERIKYKSSLKIGKRISNFDQIQIGDYVVHRIHGIGIYNGVVTIEKNKLKMDYIQILYKGNDKVYIPIDKINTIFKYTIKDGRAPAINKLNSLDWERKKQKARKNIEDISNELIELYAERNKQYKEPFISYEDEIKFSNEFIYEPTQDQLKAIEDIDKDLISTKPMDRLLCGDVGYGKTEVAFRTIFKTVMNGFQVAYLCPTTILSHQQYQSALDRFKNYPINIELLNRFISPKEEKRIISGLEAGLIDVVIGTHKLLNNKIKYKNLNLLIIDEEQRFGVIHKEKIKSIKKDVNVLTLSATPIPRTLKMSLSGIRDLSIIDTPPNNRYPVQTYVIEEDELLIKDVIYKEISRNGQCFILYNRVNNIEEKAYSVSKMVPEAKVISAHGQMNKDELEGIMTDFVNEKYNVLVCTTIIESGIDIPNVNTLVVIDADQFGLSQLYQIRGRVGRSDRIAYAYLMYKKNRILTDSAIKRLKSIQEFTELGSGYKIAMRDLAIRGAGDILGSEQAGFIDSVGIELYMQMITEKVNELNNIVVENEVEYSNLVDVETHIPDSFVDDEMIKIEIHKKINEINSREKLHEIKREMEDRFGKLTDNLVIYMHQRLFEFLANKNQINQIEINEQNIRLIISKKISQKIDGEKLLKETYKINKTILINHHNQRINIQIYPNKLDKHYIYYLLNIVELFDNKTILIKEV